LVANLFVQPGYGQYVFGDYYDRSFLAVGIFPWFSFSYISGPSRPVFYDPVFSFYASINVTRDPGWVTRVQREYIVRRENVALRPPRTFVEQTRIIKRTGGGRDLAMARPIHELARHPEAGGGMRLERLSAESQRRWQERGAQLAQFRSQRTQLERQAGAERRGAISQGRGSALAARSRSLALPSSPVSAPIHHHVASGDPIGPSGHNEHQTARQAQAEHTGPRYEDWGLESSPRRQAGAPMIHHDLDSSEHSLRLGQAAPHDVGRTPMVRSQTPMVGHDSATRSDQPRLHVPPQYTHRQPPPAPRPVQRNESRER
jgi:hypothetical protein